MAAKDGSASAGGRPARVCSRCQLTHSTGCRHCFCNGEFCDHEDEQCDTLLSAACNGSICSGCRRGVKKVKLEEEVRSSAPASPGPSSKRGSSRVPVDERQAVFRNMDMMENCMFLDPLRTSMGHFTPMELELLSPFLRLMDSMYRWSAPGLQYELCVGTYCAILAEAVSVGFLRYYHLSNKAWRNLQ